MITFRLMTMAVVVLFGRCAREERIAANEPEPRPAVEAILEAFDRVPLVGLGEAHGLQEQHDFIASLIGHPDFGRVVDDVVVEFGSARYQGLVDRYVAGDSVDAVDLRQVWRNTTQFLAWDAPLYERFFALVRDLNQRRPPAERLRVILADPPIDWDRIRTASDFLEWYERNGRNEFAAQVVEREVLQRQRKALLIAGTTHLMRPSAEWRREFPEGGPNQTGYIEARHPGSMFLVTVHAGPRDGIREIEPRIAAWPTPSIALLDGNWLGETDLGDARLGELWDAYLYLGPISSLRRSVPPRETYDEAYLAELERRHALLHEAGVLDEPFNGAWLRRERSTPSVEPFE